MRIGRIMASVRRQKDRNPRSADLVNGNANGVIWTKRILLSELEDHRLRGWRPITRRGILVTDFFADGVAVTLVYRTAKDIPWTERVADWFRRLAHRIEMKMRGKKK